MQIVAALLADETDRPIAELAEELAGEEDRLNSLDYGTDLSVHAALALSAITGGICLAVTFAPTLRMRSALGTAATLCR